MASARNSFSPTYNLSLTTLTTTSQQRIVSKLVLEGKAKNNGANVKLYLKVCLNDSMTLGLYLNYLELSIPADSITPSMPVALFPGSRSMHVTACLLANALYQSRGLTQDR